MTDAADADHRQDDQGQGLPGDREQERLARQGAAAGHGRPRHRRAWRRAQHHRAGPAAGRTSSQRHARRRSPSQLPDLCKWHAGGDPHGLWRRAQGAGRGAARCRRAGWRGQQLDLCRDFAKAFPDRFFEKYIAEQQMVAAAVGLQVRGYVPFASTFAAFFSRAYDFIRMAAISQRQHPPRAARTRASPSARMAPRRWRWKTWR